MSIEQRAAEQRSVVVCSVLERDADSTAAWIRRAPPACGLVEIRADHLRRSEIGTLVRGAGRPVVVTVRRQEDGGGWVGDEDSRRALLLEALAAGARYVDVEHDGSLAGIAEGAAADRVILSHHGADCEPATLARLYRRMSASAAARLKIVPCAARAYEVGAVRDLLRRAGSGRLVCFASGAAGVTSRLMACAWGSWATYGSTRRGAEAAPGQLTAEDLLETYDVLAVDDRTSRFALLGNDLSRSPSPALHRAAYRACGLQAVYLPLEATELGDVEALLAPGSPLGLQAVGVTMPFKEAMARLASPADAAAAAAGAVNTVVLTPGGWRGYNTDGPAALERIRRHVDPAGLRVAVVGAGGTARAIAAVLVDAGADVTMFNRGRERVERAAAELGASAAPLDALDEAPWDVLANATPLGRGGEEIVAPERLRGRLVLDAVYAAEPTPLCRAAAERGVASIDGFELLVAQAVRQFAIMTGREVEFACMAAAGKQWLLRAAP